MCAGYHRLHRHLDHRCDERGWNAVSGDVSHEDADPVLIDGNEFVEIAGDGGHRMISGVDTKALEFRSAARKNRTLDLAGDLEFVLNGEQAAFVGEDLLCGYVSK